MDQRLKHKLINYFRTRKDGIEFEIKTPQDERVLDRERLETEKEIIMDLHEDVLRTRN